MSDDRVDARGAVPQGPPPSVVRRAWDAMDRALAAYRAGRRDASFTVRTDVAEPEEQPAAAFFRTPAEMPTLERVALASSYGRVLDLGAGAGAHTLPLLRRGLHVVAAEPLPAAAEILRERGAPDVRQGGLETLAGDERFDTVLLLMNGAGLAGTLAGVPALLAALRACLAPDGQVLLDSTDPREWGDAEDGRYPGEIHYQLEFEGERGPPFPFLYLDADMLATLAGAQGWSVEVLVTEEDGRYLARLS